MKLELDLDDRFRDGIENGDIAADAGIRYVVGDTYLDGSPTEYDNREAVVLYLRRLCEALVDAMDGESVDVHYLLSSHTLHIDPGDGGAVSLWTSSRDAAETEMQRLARGVVVSAERLADEVEDVNPVLANTSSLQDLRSAITRLKVLYTDEFGEILRT